MVVVLPQASVNSRLSLIVPEGTFTGALSPARCGDLRGAGSTNRRVVEKERRAHHGEANLCVVPSRKSTDSENLRRSNAAPNALLQDHGRVAANTAASP